GSKVTSQTESLLKSNAQLTTKVSEIDDKLQNSQGTIEQTNYRVDRLAQQLTDLQRNFEQIRSAPAGSSMPGGPSQTGTPLTQTVNVSPGSDPMETYQTAYRDYQKGNFDLAMQGFREFLQNNPASDLADNAAYWIGESLFSQKKYREAIEQFDMVINSYPKSDKVPAALLKKGYGYIELGQKAQGVVQLQYVIHEHPTSREATLARQKLKAVGIDNP
ncbi:MAG: tol-pal system protein YbgF, partial [Acidobacteriota bacterium]